MFNKTINVSQPLKLKKTLKSLSLLWKFLCFKKSY